MQRPETLITRRVTYRRLSNLRSLNHQAAWRQLNGSLIESSAGWTTYGTLSEESFMPVATFLSALIRSIRVIRVLLTCTQA